ncbi:NAD(P)H-dependent flavin oxidoreductase [Nitrospirillum iridis]|uniref:Nitronate monooxygenase n=1 Tax=Nitrospirillum iridis TaxID=765888 RepID=A0A7X0EB69_9PROT|nr:nitronate monooxygenase family protein [Nitrospirillum iridis]MBB6250332.1 nitronate monooxygenase [Nitrospirillum iridis]
MTAWPDRRILDLFGIDKPILQAPMANATTPAMAMAVSEAGGLGSLPAAQYTLDGLRAAVAEVRRGTKRPYNINFFCHTPPVPDPARLMAWRARLAPYYVELGLDPEATPPAGGRTPFDADFCTLVEEVKPPVVSFHFGLPGKLLLDRVKASGAKVIASATTVAEARWLEHHGVDAVIAMGLEAGGHRGNFLSDDMATQVGTFALVPQVADAVTVPVIAAGGIADARGIVAAMMLGASAVQIGTAYLFSPEAKIPEVHRQALESATDDGTALTNLFTGRPARGFVNRLMREVGPLSTDPTAFPTAGGALAPLRAKAEAAGSGDFTNQWAGQAARLSRSLPAGELTAVLAQEALALLTGHRVIDR